MQKFYHNCAALLLAVGLLFPCTTALAQMPEEGSMAVGLSSVDSGLPPTPDNGVVVVVWESEACYIEAESPLDKLPSKVKINAGRKEASGDGIVEYLGQFWVNVLWDTAAVDCSRPGTYNITGVLDAGALSALGIANPDGLTAALTVVVQKRGPIETLAGKLVRANESYMRFQLYFPLLPSDATALYVERETEPNVWQRLSVPGGIDNDGNPQTNFLESSRPMPPEQLISYYLSPPVPQLRLRIEVVGSLYAGISNEVEILADGGSATLPPPKPDDKPEHDDGSSGGNRGGGTQGESDRPGKAEEENPKEEPAAQSGSLSAAPIVPMPPAAPESSPDAPTAPTAATTSSVPREDKNVSSAPSEPQAQETLAPIVEEPPAAAPPPPPDKGHTGTVAVTTAAILVAGAGGTYLFKIRRKP